MSVSTVFIITISSLIAIFIGLDSGFYKRFFRKKTVSNKNVTIDVSYAKLLTNTDLSQVLNNRLKNAGTHHVESEYISRADAYSVQFFELQNKAFELFK